MSARCCGSESWRRLEAGWLKLELELDAWELELEPWGDDAEIIEDWFEAGEAIQHADSLLLELGSTEPHGLARALDWVRGLLVAS